MQKNGNQSNHLYVLQLTLTNKKYYSIVLCIEHTFSICYREDVRETWG